MTAYDYQGHMLNSSKLLQMDYERIKKLACSNRPSYQSTSD